MEQQSGSMEEKEYVKAVYCHPAYLTYMQSSVQFSHSVMSDLCDSMTTASQATLSITKPQSSPKPTSIKSVMHTMRNAGLEETQAGIKIDGRNINNLRYENDTTLMAESEEELKSLLMKVKEENEEVGLKFNIQ